MILGGTVGLIVRNGGTHGVIAHVVRWARTPRSGQLSTWVMGLLVFFDDYSNTLIVGNTMRPITDRLRISREKLAYLVDCTAAPVASVAVVSSWIGVEVGYIAGALQSEGIDRSAYLLFIESIPYRFYPIWPWLSPSWWATSTATSAHARRRASSPSRRQGARRRRLTSR